MNAQIWLHLNVMKLVSNAISGVNWRANFRNCQFDIAGAINLMKN